MRLTGKQLAFANHVLDGIGNNAEAYRLAYGKHGCSVSQARTEGYRIRHHPLVDAYIREEQRRLRERMEGRATTPIQNGDISPAFSPAFRAAYRDIVVGKESPHTDACKKICLSVGPNAIPDTASEPLRTAPITGEIHEMEVREPGRTPVEIRRHLADGGISRRLGRVHEKAISGGLRL